MNNKSPCNTPSIPKSFKCSNDAFNLLRKPALLTGSSFLVVSGWFVSISSGDLFNFAFWANTPLVPTKNFPSSGSVPANTAVSYTHLRAHET